MKQIKRLIGLILIVLAISGQASAQVVVGGDADYDIDYLTPRTYEIGGITFEGADNFDTRVVQLVAGLQVGDRVKIPGDRISAAVENLWKQGMFEDVQIKVTRVQGNIAFLKIVLKERPRLDGFSFTGVRKGEADKLRDEIKLVTGDVVTENLLRTSVNRIKAYYITRGYTQADVVPETKADTSGKVAVVFNVKRGKKVKIDSLIFEGNEQVKEIDLKMAMQKTHDVNYWKKFRVLTKGFWSKSKYIENDFRTDLDNVITYYNEQGYRDARIVSDTVWTVPASELKMSEKKKAKQDRVKVKVGVHEGHKFYFRNITFSGNTVYDDDVLRRSMRIEKGDPYNRTLLEQNLQFNPSGTDVTSLYVDNGYLFFRAVPVEVGVEGDSIDIEIRIVEGDQARIRNVIVEGNTVTNDKVIMRELYTRPGDLFSRDAILRSRRELATLGYFKEETIIPEPHPNAKDGTVDIVYKVEEGQTSQLNVQGGYAAGRLLGQLGVQLNNFSLRNIFNRDAWAPLPAGDGQKLGLNIVTNGLVYNQLSASFTEPWLGGRRPQSLTASVYYTFYSNGLQYKRSDENYSSLSIAGGGISIGRRLKWPDDYFSMSHGISYKHYVLNNYTLAPGVNFTTGSSNDISYGFTLSRNSLDSPIYPRSGSDVSFSTFITPPYSLISGKDFSNATIEERNRWQEYYKFNVRGSWMLNLIGDVVLNARFRMGFMGYYNKDVGLTAFGRYFLGGSGLSSLTLDGREVVPLRGYSDNALSPQSGASVFDKFTLELRQPIMESNQMTIWVLGFLEGGNSWATLAEFQPFKMYNSAGLGVRLYVPMLGGLLGFDWGYGFDGENGGSNFHFSINQSID